MAATRVIPRSNQAVAAIVAALAFLLVAIAPAGSAVPSRARVASIKPACSLLPLAAAAHVLGTAAKAVPAGPLNCEFSNKQNPLNRITLAINYPETKATFAAAHKGLVRVPGFGNNSGCTTMTPGYDQCQVWSANEDIIVSFEHRTRYTPGHNSTPLKVTLAAMATICRAVVSHL
jgi:hypothetical protein